MQPHKSLTELEADRQTVINAMGKQGVDASEMQWYKNGLARIDEAIRLKKASMQNRNPAPKQEPQQPQQPQRPQPQRPQPQRPQPDNIRELKPADNGGAMPSAKRQNALGNPLSEAEIKQRAAWKRDVQRQGANYAGTGADTADTTISAETLAMFRKVKIAWEEGKTETLMEGQVRSRFVTTLRDLVNSRHAAEERWDALAQYVSFSRAVTYYRALRIFWSGDPSAAQLRIQLVGKTKETIFHMIVKSAQDDNAEA